MLNKVVSEDLSEKVIFEQRLMDICEPVSHAGVLGRAFQQYSQYKCPELGTCHVSS